MSIMKSLLQNVANCENWMIFIKLNLLQLLEYSKLSC